MKCPIDDTVLQMNDRQGIEIDYCPQCRGVWLDRGELDKLIERSAVAAPTPSAPQAPPPGPSYESGRPSYPPQSYDDRRYSKKRKKDSFLGDLFDF
jgi:uncharacterized protein